MFPDFCLIFLIFHCHTLLPGWLCFTLCHLCHTLAPLAQGVRPAQAKGGTCMTLLKLASCLCRLFPEMNLQIPKFMQPARKPWLVPQTLHTVRRIYQSVITTHPYPHIPCTQSYQYIPNIPLTHSITPTTLLSHPPEAIHNHLKFPPFPHTWGGESPGGYIPQAAPSTTLPSQAPTTIFWAHITSRW